MKRLALLALAACRPPEPTLTGGCWLVRDMHGTMLEQRWHYPRCPARPHAEVMHFEGQHFRIQWETVPAV